MGGKWLFLCSNFLLEFGLRSVDKSILYFETLILGSPNESCRGSFLETRTPDIQKSNLEIDDLLPGAGLVVLPMPVYCGWSQGEHEEDS